MQKQTIQSKVWNEFHPLKILFAGAVLLCMGSLYVVFFKGVSDRLILIPYWTSPRAYDVLLYSGLFVYLVYRYGKKGFFAFLFIEALDEASFFFFFPMDWNTFYATDPLYPYKILFQLGFFCLATYLFSRANWTLKPKMLPLFLGFIGIFVGMQLSGNSIPYQAFVYHLLYILVMTAAITQEQNLVRIFLSSHFPKVYSFLVTYVNTYIKRVYYDFPYDFTEMKGKYVVECGANIGHTTKKLASLAKFVYAFEPVPISFRTLKRRVRELNNVEVYNCGLGSGTQQVEINVNYPISGANGILMQDQVKYIDKLPIDLFELDNKLAGQKVDTLILDCEGYELEVLKGARKKLRNEINTVYIELHYIKGKRTDGELLLFLSAMGFEGKVTTFRFRPEDSWIKAERTNYKTNHL